MSVEQQPPDSQEQRDLAATPPAAEQPAPLDAPPPPGHTPVLQKLSAPPFPRTGFPLLGILASVYEHVTEVAARARGCGAAKPVSPSDEERAA